MGADEIDGLAGKGICCHAMDLNGISGIHMGEEESWHIYARAHTHMPTLNE